MKVKVERSRHAGACQLLERRQKKKEVFLVGEATLLGSALPVTVI